MGAQTPIAASLHAPMRGLLMALSRVDRNGDGYKAVCPICGGELKVWEDEDGYALLQCPASCSLESILEAVGKTKADCRPRSVLDPVTGPEYDDLIEAERWGDFAGALDVPPIGGSEPVQVFYAAPDHHDDHGGDQGRQGYRLGVGLLASAVQRRDRVCHGD